MKRFVAIVVLALLALPMAGPASAGPKEHVNCLYYSTFAERDLTDCL
jgi:hypothetical protein